MSDAYAYIRVSEVRPDQEKLSPEAQRQRVQKTAEDKGLRLVRVFEDLDVNSANIKRKGTWGELAAVVKPGDTVIANEFTRIGRNTIETLERMNHLIKSDVNIIALDLPYDTTGHMGQFITTILAAGAQMENQQRAERVRQVQRPLAESGKWSGGRLPYGYRYRDKARKDFTIEVNENEAGIVREIFTLAIAGNGQIRICKHLEARGVPAPRAAHWVPRTVVNILANRSYVSQREYDGEIFPLDIPAIVDEETWEQAQAVRKIGPTPAKRQYLLSGLLKCSKCGANMIHKPRIADTAPQYVCYRSRVGIDCTGVSISEHIADEAVLEQFFEHVETEGYNDAVDEWEYKETQAPELASLRKRLAACEVKRNRILDLYADGTIDKPTCESKLAPIDKQASALTAEIESVEAGVKLPPRWEGDIRKDWEFLNLDEKRHALKLFIDRVEIEAGGRGKGRVRVVWR